MAAGTEVRVPDIGDFKNVEVIEVLVKPGDAVSKEQSLITLESDKATMEIPSPGAGGWEGWAQPGGQRFSRGPPRRWGGRPGTQNQRRRPGGGAQRRGGGPLL